MNEMNYLSAGLEFFAALIALVMLIGCIIEKQYLSKIGRFLFGLLTVHFLMLVVDAPIWLLLINPSPTKVVVIKILSLLSDICPCIIISLYSYCLTEYISLKKKISYKYANIITALCGIAIILSFINVFNGMYVYYDDLGVTHNGPLYLLSWMVFIILPALTMMLAVYYEKILGLRDTLIMVIFGIIPTIAIPLQVFWEVTPVYLGTTISLVLVYTLVHVAQVKMTDAKEKKYMEQELELSENRSAVMLSQIQPHFLYNALNSIYQLCDSKPEMAKEAISEFSKYLRGNLDSIKQKKLVTFSEELNHIQAYLMLEKIRYEDELEIVYDIKVEDFLLPALTVQPIIENAVNHGISDLPNGGIVTLKTEEKEDCYEVTVIDNGVGFDPNKIKHDGRTHIGIPNVRNRLDIMCHGTLEIISEINKGTTAIVRIPKGEDNANSSGR